MPPPNMSRNDLKIESAYIDGMWTSDSAGAPITVHNPATDEVLGTVPNVGTAGTGNAITAAQNAFTGWRQTNPVERAEILRKWHHALLENQEDLATLMTLEQGKVLTESRGEIAYAANFIQWFAEEAVHDVGQVVPSPATQRVLVLPQPVGVCGLITPWNFPAAMITRKIAPALAAGCSVVIKPASQTPFTALALAKLGEEAGIPPGVINVVTGNASEIGKTLCESEVVRKISFTGSTNVGRLLMRQSADTVKRVSMELGGNAPFIVFDDANIDAAIEGAMTSKFRNSGQTCVCANRFLVQDTVYDTFVDGFAQKAKQLSVGNGWEDGVSYGPLIDDKGIAKIEMLIADAVHKGAEIVIGGKRHPKGGRFFLPTVLRNTNASMEIFKQEIFGPVAAITRFSDEEEAIALANQTEYGLASYAYTGSQSHGWQLADRLETGMLGINAGLISTYMAPFGGVKHSGVGREGGRYGLAEYQEPQYLYLAQK